jgi:hypothetical protein
MTKDQDGRTLGDDARKFLGLAPYDKLNFCYLDGYFSLDCRQRYGESVWNAYIKLLGGT